MNIDVYHIGGIVTETTNVTFYHSLKRMTVGNGGFHWLHKPKGNYLFRHGYAGVDEYGNTKEGYCLVIIE